MPAMVLNLNFRQSRNSSYESVYSHTAWGPLSPFRSTGMSQMGCCQLGFEAIQSGIVCRTDLALDSIPGV